MAYKALYREYRPQTFDEVVGQKYIVQTLKNEIRDGKVNHAYLFTGPRGTGKTTIAKLIAKGLNCLNENKPCGECENCRAIAKGTYPDVIEMDAASNNGVDEVRELIEKVKFTPMQGKYKVYIIDEVHMMTSAAFNALLKTLEEPPENVVFILATTEVHKVPATIVSRCQRFDFGRISQKDLEKKLTEVLDTEGITYEPGVVNLVAALADGGVRDALGILEQTIAYRTNNITEQAVRDIYGVLSTNEAINFLKTVNEHQVINALKNLDVFDQKGVDIPRFTTMLVNVLKEVIVYNKTDSVEHLQLLNSDNIVEIAHFMDSNTAFKYIDILLEALNSYPKVNAPRSYFELAILKLCDVESTPDREIKYVQKDVQPVIKEEVVEPVVEQHEEIIEEVPVDEPVVVEPVIQKEQVQQEQPQPIFNQVEWNQLEEDEDDKTVGDIIEELGAIDYEYGEDFNGYEVFKPVYEYPNDEDKLIFYKDGKARLATDDEVLEYYCAQDEVEETTTEEAPIVEPVVSEPVVEQQVEAEQPTFNQVEWNQPAVESTEEAVEEHREEISTEEPSLVQEEVQPEISTEEPVVEETPVVEQPQPTFNQVEWNKPVEETTVTEEEVVHKVDKVEPVEVTKEMVINYLVQSNKDIRISLSNIWNSLHKYCSMPKYVRAANCLRDGKIAAASENGILVCMDTRSEADIANSPEMYFECKELIAELFGKEYKYIATNTEDFKEIKVIFRQAYDTHTLPLPKPIVDLYNPSLKEAVKGSFESEETKNEVNELKSIFGDMLKSE